MFSDKRGVAFTAASQQAVDAFDASVDEFMAAGRDAGRLLQKVDAVDPDMVMGQVLRGYFLRLPAQPRLAEHSLEALENARRLAADASARERAHVGALDAWCAGDIRRTTAIWDEILLEHPLDLLALRIAHTMHFFLGDLSRMRAAMARVMPFWSESLPGFGFVLGCRAFSLEENHEFAEAERLGRRAVEINENDVWAGHCVAHVLEAQERREEGIRWVDAHQQAWAARGKFANHLWWHRALHYLELERFEQVLSAFDREFWAEPSDDNTDIGNASSMLMRLSILGVDVGERWGSVADAVEPYLHQRLRPFNDLHYMMALAMSGRMEKAQALLDSMRAVVFGYLHNGSDETRRKAPVTIAEVYSAVGLDVAQAILAYAQGRYEAVVQIMNDARHRMLALGGSWAQRDVWVRMLIDSALKSGNFVLARGLLSERVDTCPRSAPSHRLYAKALQGCGAVNLAARERAHAAELIGN